MFTLIKKQRKEMHEKVDFRGVFQNRLHPKKNKKLPNFLIYITLLNYTSSNFALGVNTCSILKFLWLNSILLLILFFT